jgi:hypothetical protein
MILASTSEGMRMPGEGQAMSDNVVALRGEFQPPAAEVNQRLIEEIERLLQAARAGEIIGMAGAYLHKDKCASYSFAGVIGAYSLVGGLECAKARLLAIIMGR